MHEVPHESCKHWLDLREHILVYVSCPRAKPYMPVTCPFLEHHLDALTKLVVAPKLVVAVAVAPSVFVMPLVAA